MDLPDDERRPPERFKGIISCTDKHLLERCQAKNQCDCADATSATGSAGIISAKGSVQRGPPGVQAGRRGSNPCSPATGR